MKIQRFEADTAEEALRLAAAALGSDAVVLHTGRAESGSAGQCSSRVEVVAAVDVAAARQPVRPTPFPAVTESVMYRVDEPWQDEVRALRLQVARLQSQMPANREQSGGQASMGTLPAARLFAGEGPAAAWRTAAEMAQRLREAVRTRTIEMRPGVCTAVALVGPTGVGKTTTAAKLAAAAALGEGRRVGFINLDTYRIGAAAQLETYGRLLDCPVVTARTAEELWAARRQLSDRDLILIDTTGRSPRNTQELLAQAKVLEAGRPDEVHLLLDTRNSREVHRSVLRGYGLLRPTHLCLCKLDELAPSTGFQASEGLSGVMQEALQANLAFSYLTTGQKVPEDVAPATCENVLACLTGSL